MKDTEALLDEYISLVNSESNQRNKQYWANSDERYLHERWRGRSNRKENVPFTMAMDISGYCKVLEFNCAEYYQNPATHLQEQLRYAIWEARNFDCQRYFENAVFIAQGSVFEASWFGARIHYLDNQAPWYNEKEPVFSDKKNLLAVKPFDFFSSGLCPTVHHFYEVICRKTAGYPVDVMFPLALRSPFSIAIMLRGFENLLTDIYDDPAFFHDLLDIISCYLKEYASARSIFLNEQIASGMLFNDEISTPILSADMYRKMILPFELDLSRHCNGIRYWHSCGVTQDFYESVSSIPGLKMMHIGPWSDIGRAVEVFGPKNIALEICVNSVRDMYDKSENEMIAQLSRIKALCDGRICYSVRCDGIAIRNSIEECLNKIKTWNKAARMVFSDVK